MILNAASWLYCLENNCNYVKRLIEVQEIADYALFLASDKAKGVTGQSIILDSGYTAQ